MFIAQSSFHSRVATCSELEPLRSLSTFSGQKP